MGLCLCMIEVYKNGALDNFENKVKEWYACLFISLWIRALDKSLTCLQSILFKNGRIDPQMCQSQDTL